MEDKKAYYESFGCQMNAYDTEVIESLLTASGMVTVDDPAEADLIVVNTCSVRENAERRAIGRLNDLSRHGSALLAVVGCMARRMGAGLFEKVQGLSLVAGPDTYMQLPGAVMSLLEDGGRTVLDFSDDDITYTIEVAGRGSSRVSRFISITRGCDNFCSYCIVPYLRGPVRSKEPKEIIREVVTLVSTGVSEITLLGQNVMAYRHGETDFCALARSILGNTGVGRLRFLTTHPRDLDVEVFRLMNEDGRLCPHIHLPVQSGSDRILGMMRRGYDRRRYIDLISAAREIRPDLAVSTDFIVGFPSETDDDFDATMELAGRCGFDSAFTFKYSPRSGTGAAALDDDVPAEVKAERLQRLNSLIAGGRREILESRLGSEDEILLDDTVKKGETRYWKGRTPHFRNVLLEGAHLKKGDIINVSLSEIRNFTFIAEEIPRR